MQVEEVTPDEIRAIDFGDSKSEAAVKSLQIAVRNEDVRATEISLAELKVLGLVAHPEYDEAEKMLRSWKSELSKAAASEEIGGGTDSKQEALKSWNDQQKGAIQMLKQSISKRDLGDLQQQIAHAKKFKVHEHRKHNGLIMEAEAIIAEIEAEVAGEQMATSMKQKADAMEEKSRGFVLHPQQKIMQRWDLIMMSAMVFTAVVTPFEVAFMETKLDALFFINRLWDVIFASDIFLQFHLSYYDAKRGRWVVTPGAIRRHYFLTWFFLDFVSTIPYDLIGFMMTSEAASDALEKVKVLRILKLLKLVKMLRMLRSARVFRRLAAAMNLTNSTLNLVKFLVTVCVVIHWTACVWRITPVLEGQPTHEWHLHGDEQKEKGTWVGENWITMMLAAEGGTTTYTNDGDLYMQCLEYSLMIMVMGYGTVRPQTSFERVISIVCMLVAGSVYAYVIGAICSVVSMRDPASIKYQETTDLLKQYMEENKLPLPLRFRMTGYFEHCKQLFRNTLYQEQITGMMTPELQKGVAIHCHRTWIDRVPFFHVDSEKERALFTTGVANYLHACAFPPEESIYLPGEEAMEMYILTRGVVRKRGHLISKGNFFGEEMIMSNAVRTEEAVALTYVDCSTLERSDLVALLVKGGTRVFPETTRLIRRARIRMCFKKVMREIGYSVILMKRQNWRQWGRQYRRMTYTELEDYKTHLFERVREAQAIADEKEAQRLKQVEEHRQQKLLKQKLRKAQETSITPKDEAEEEGGKDEITVSKELPESTSGGQDDAGAPKALDTDQGRDSLERQVYEDREEEGDANASDETVDHEDTDNFSLAQAKAAKRRSALELAKAQLEREKKEKEEGLKVELAKETLEFWAQKKCATWESKKGKILRLGSISLAEKTKLKLKGKKKLPPPSLQHYLLGIDKEEVAKRLSKRMNGADGENESEDEHASQMQHLEARLQEQMAAKIALMEEKMASMLANTIGGAVRSVKEEMQQLRVFCATEATKTSAALLELVQTSEQAILDAMPPVTQVNSSITGSIDSNGELRPTTSPSFPGRPHTPIET